MRSRRPTIRTAALGLAGIAIAGILAGYGVLAWTTKDQPGPVHLPSAAPSSQTSFSQTDPSGKWVIDPEAGSFVGYRAKELLAVDFVASPNDAVGRSTTVDGSIDIEGGKLIKASLTANVADLRSDEDLRDQHLVEGLKLAHDPTASFDSTNAVDLGAIKVGEPVEVDVPGTLTIKGEARPIVAHVDGRWDGGRIALAGSMVIHRADFDLNMDQLVVFRVADDITIEFQLGLVPSCAPSCVAGLPTPAPTPAASPSTSPSESPVPTPSGALASTSGRFAISGLTDRGESAPPVEEIYLVDADGRSLTLLTKQGSMAEFPAWSRDGSQIAYTLRSVDPIRNDEQELGLWVVAARGGTPRQLVKDPARQPAWSPDGSRIAFVSREEDGGRLFIVNTDGSGLRKVDLPAGTASTPAWSADGRLAFAFFPEHGNGETILIADASGRDPRPFVEAGTYAYAPSWSRDGRWIAFVADGEVARARADGTGVTVLTSDLAADRPSFSPDGRRIVFTQNDGTWVMNADGSGATKLDIKLDYAGFASWDPNAR